MLTLTRTDSDHAEFKALVQLLDQELAVRDGDDHAFYHQFNKIDLLKQVILIQQEGAYVGCGAIKAHGAQEMEVKRMYVLPEYRGQGIAVLILEALEDWTRESGIHSCILETGINQPEAIRLYEKCGYERIPNYGQYEGVEASYCFRKNLR